MPAHAAPVPEASPPPQPPSADTYRPEHLKPPEHRRGAFFSPRTWLLPLLVLLLLGGTGSALYIGGLGSPGDHLRHFPIAVVNEDRGAETTGADGAQTQENLGQTIEDNMRQGTSGSDEVDLRELSWDQAQEQLRKGQIYAAVVIPESFSADAVGLVSSALTQTEARRPAITVYSNPLASPLGTRLAEASVDPALSDASAGLGEQLTASSQQAQDQARQQAQARLAQLPAAVRAQLGTSLDPTVDGTAAALLRDPIQVDTTAYREPPEGAALGMGAFFYSVLLMVVGLSGSVALHFLVDSRTGVLPVELGTRFVLGPRLRPSRWGAFALKWGIAVLSGLPMAGLMMWIAHLVGMPIPHGFWFFVSTWLSFVTVASVVLALITLLGSAGMIVSVIYVVFMGLPAASGVVPLEALPRFFDAIARGEPLYQMTIANKAILYFDAEADAGLQAGVIGMLVIILIAVVLALIGGFLYDRWFGRRAAVPDPEQAPAPSPAR